MDTRYVETFLVGTKPINIAGYILSNTFKTLQNWSNFLYQKNFISHTCSFPFGNLLCLF